MMTEELRLVAGHRLTVPRLLELLHDGARQFIARCHIQLHWTAHTQDAEYRSLGQISVVRRYLPRGRELSAWLLGAGLLAVGTGVPLLSARRRVNA